MEKLDLHTFLTFDKLNIVNEKHVSQAVMLAECCVVVILDASDEFVDKLLGLNINHSFSRKINIDSIADGMQKVSFAQAGTTVNKERIIVARILHRCDRNTSSVSKLVIAAYNKAIKSVLRVEL